MCRRPSKASNRHELSDLKPTRSSFGRILDRFRYRGAYVDYWTYIHFAAGMLTGLLLAGVGMHFLHGFGIAVCAFILWELAEPSLHRLIGRQFPEKMTNQITDVLSGTIGYVFGFILVGPFTLRVLLWILDVLAN